MSNIHLKCEHKYEASFGAKVTKNSVWVHYSASMIMSMWGKWRQVMEAVISFCRCQLEDQLPKLNWAYLMVSGKKGVHSIRASTCGETLNCEVTPNLSANKTLCPLILTRLFVGDVLRIKCMIPWNKSSVNKTLTIHSLDMLWWSPSTSIVLEVGKCRRFGMIPARFTLHRGWNLEMPVLGTRSGFPGTTWQNPPLLL